MPKMMRMVARLIPLVALMFCLQAWSEEGAPGPGGTPAPTPSPSASASMQIGFTATPSGYYECTQACIADNSEQEALKKELVEKELPRSARKKGETFCASQGPGYSLMKFDPAKTCNQVEALGQCTVEGVSENLKHVRCAMKCQMYCEYIPPAPSRVDEKRATRALD